MGVGLYLNGTFPLEQSSDDWLEEVASWLESHEEEPLMFCQFGENDAAQPTLFLQVHPCAEDVEISMPEPGVCLVNAKTSTAGPGYHIFLCELLHSLGKHFHIEWDTPEEEIEGDETGYFFQRDASAVRQEMLRWLSAISRVVADNSKDPENIGLQMVAMPLERRYPDQAGILTPIGPRSPEWFEELVETPERGIEFFPWWPEGIGAGFFLGRAVCRLWQEIRWRTPITEDEGELVMDAHLDLERAFHLDPHANIPWREWRDLVGYLNDYFGYAEFLHEETQEGEIDRRAEEVDPNTPLIGYRRGRVDVTLSGGWSLTIPGEFAEEWDENGEGWSAWLGGRTIWFKPWSVSGPHDESLTAQEILDSLPWPEDAEIIEYEDGELASRAIFVPCEEDGQALWNLKACSAITGKFAECNIYLQDESDLDWALEIWKSLRN